MPRIIQSVHLSDYQARVMLMAHQAQTPELAFAEYGGVDERIRPNLLTARETLAKIGLLEIGQNSIAVTEKGMEVMKDEYLIDDMGEVTDKGHEILQTEEKEEPTPSDTPGDEMNDMPPGGAEMANVSAGGEMETTPGSGFPAEGSIFRHINDLAKILRG